MVLNSHGVEAQDRGDLWDGSTYDVGDHSLYGRDKQEGLSGDEIRAGKGSYRRRLLWKHLQKAKEVSDYGRS